MELTIEQALELGVESHKKGKLQDAKRFYLAILQSQPLHPDANHNLGVLAVSVNQTDAALPLFKTALKANPKVEQFWLSYIRALIKEKQFYDAKQVLEQGRREGLSGDKVDALESHFTSKTQVNKTISAVQKKNLSLPEKHKKLFEKKKKANKQTLENMSPSESEINNLIHHYQNGRYGDAEKLAVSITQKFPKYQFGWKVLGALLQQTGRVSESLVFSQKAAKLIPQDAEVQYNLGVALQKLGRLDEAQASYRQTITLKPDLAEAHFSLGATFKELGRLDEAQASFDQALVLKPDYAQVYCSLGNMFKELGRLEETEASYKQAIVLEPDLAEAHSNLGVTLQALGRLDEAEESYKQAIVLRPNYAEAHNNLGVTLQALGRLGEAEAIFKQVIVLKPNYAEAHNNLGVTQTEQGRLEESEANYTQAIVLKSDFVEARLNLVELLTIYAPQKQPSQQIVKVDHDIKEIDLKDKLSRAISDDKIIQLFSKSSSIIKKYDLEIVTPLSQVYRRNSVDLNCKRHKLIFDTFSVIPKFCFGCYKVQVEPRSLLELIKLFVVFDQIKLVKNNTRKCMIEMRPEVTGFYKGLIYCSSLEEAYQIVDYLETVVKASIGPGLPLAVKRGCSEYAIAFPDYKKINKYGDQPMNYNDDWKLIEENYDKNNSIKVNDIITPSLSCLNLSDILIIRNWIDYAKAIGDPSAKLLNQSAVCSQTIYSIAKNRLETHPWRDAV